MTKNEIEINKKKTGEVQRYSYAKFVCHQNQALSTFTKKECCSKFIKVKLAKPK